MVDDNNLNINVTATNEAGPVLGEVAAEVEATGKKADAAGLSIGQLGSKMSAVGSSLTTAFTLPIVAVGAASIKMGVDFQQNMELIRTQAGASQKEVDALSSKVLELAKSSAQGPEVLAEGLYHLESLGLRGSAAMNALATSSQMAAVGGANLEETTSALGAALVTGIKGTENLSTAAGILDATIGAGNMRMSELVAALGTGVLPAAKNFGLSLTDVGAALATLTDNGMRADESATRLRMTFSLMGAPSQKAADALGTIGLQSDQLAKDMRSGGLIKALEDLHDHLTNSGKTAVEQSQILSEAFGGGRSSAAIMTLLEQLDRVKQKEAQIGEQSGQFNDKVAATQQTSAYKMHQAWSTVQADLIQLGDVLMPGATKAATDLANMIQGLSSWFQKLSPSQQDTAIKIAAILALSGPTLLFFGSLAKSVQSIIDLGSGMNDVLGRVPDVVGKIGDKTGDLAGKVGGIAGNIGGSVAGGAKTAGSTAVSWSKSAGSVAADVASAAGGAIKSFSLIAAAAIKNAALSSAAWIKMAADSEEGILVFSIKAIARQVAVAAAAIANAIKTAAAWSLSAAESLAAWLISVPGMLLAFATASSGAIKNAILSSVSWVASATVSTAAWVLMKATTIAGFIAMATQAVIQGAIMTATFVASAAKAVILFTWVQLVKTAIQLWAAAQWVLNAAMDANPIGLLIIGIAALAVAATLVITHWKAVSSFFSGLWSGITSGLKWALNSIIDYMNGYIRVYDSIVSKIPGGKAIKLDLIPHFAGGVKNFSGGLALVGEKGPEVVSLPAGSDVIPNNKISQMGGNTTTNIYGPITLGDSSAVESFFKRIGRNQELARRGLTPVGA